MRSEIVTVKMLKDKHLFDNFTVPFKSTNRSTGYDIVATSIKEETDRKIIYGTNLYLEPLDHSIDIRIFPRSSIHKKLLVLANSIGLCDNDYRGEIMVVFYKLFPESEPYKVGDKIAQLVLGKRYEIEFELVDELTETNRGKGGFGSTDTK